MTADWPLVLGSVVASLVVVPLVVGYLLVVRGVATGEGTAVLGAGLLAMTPGVLMGATGLWVAARGRGRATDRTGGREATFARKPND